jgi:hypothetical protein
VIGLIIITGLNKTNSARWKSNTMNNYEDKTRSSLHTEQVYYLPYPCKKQIAWWVVHKVNPHERFYTPGDVGYHDTLMLDDDVDEVYQEEELLASFIIDLGAELDDLVIYAIDIQMHVCEVNTETNKEKSSIA